MLFLFIFVLFLLVFIFLKFYAFCTYYRCKSNVCLLGKTALVTGGNSGIGYEIVLALLSRGCRVIVADKVDDPHLKERIFKETKSRNVSFKYVDLASFKSVREFAKDVINTEEKLDILINNAGVGLTETIVTEDGLDMTMQVNYFSGFLLTHLLVGLLKKSSGRVIFTSSYTAFYCNLSLDNLQPDKTSNQTIFNYPNSKLCVIIAADIFAEKLKIHNITSNSYHPGVVSTNIFKDGRKNRMRFTGATLSSIVFESCALLIGKTAQEGAQTAIYLACANEVESVTGKFFGEMASTAKPPKTGDKKFCEAMWKISEELVKLEPHEKL